ncbi:MAG: hypothetical protein GXP55_16185 [Deltaproteobacteria bacterium]|nr:hypothetical protein [Deltaproteobacteria bacterium]
MNTHALIAISETAIHLFAGVSYALVYPRTPKAPELASFATLSMALALYCFGESRLWLAQSPAEASFAVELSFLGLMLALLAFVRFTRDLAGAGPETQLASAKLWAGAGLVLLLGGLFVDPAQVSASSLRPVLTPLGLAWVAGTVTLAAMALLQMTRYARLRSDALIASATTGVGVLALAWDGVVRGASLDLPLVFGHVSVLSSVGVSYVLLRRLVRTGDKLTQRTRDLRQSYAELRLAQEALVHKEQLAAVGELSAVIAHEVRNPLAVLKNATSALRRPDLPEQGAVTLLGILDEETDRLNRLVNDLLAYAKPLELQAAPVNLAALLTRALELARGAPALGEGVELLLHLEAGPREFFGDSNLLERALANVVDNALDAMDGNGELAISAERAELPGGEPAVKLVFADSGEGMDTLVRKRAVDPFFTTRPSGTGLGLAIVDRVIRAHGGDMQIRSRQEHGTQVEMLLPLQRLSTIPPPPG